VGHYIYAGSQTSAPFIPDSEKSLQQFADQADHARFTACITFIVESRQTSPDGRYLTGLVKGHGAEGRRGGVQGLTAIIVCGYN
jgi:hypothetical protein